MQLFILPRLTMTLKARHSLKLDQLQRFSQLFASVTKLETSILESAHSIESQTELPKLEVKEFKVSEEKNDNKTYRDLVRAILCSSSESRMSASEIISKAREAFPEAAEDTELEVMSC
jgi:hypothetical protein